MTKVKIKRLFSWLNVALVKLDPFWEKELDPFSEYSVTVLPTSVCQVEHDWAEEMLLPIPPSLCALSGSYARVSFGKSFFNHALINTVCPR